MDSLEAKTPLIVTRTCCPVTNVRQSFDERDRNLYRELNLQFEVIVEIGWVINDEMQEHLDEFPTVMISEVVNYSLDLIPNNAKRTGRSMSLLKTDFLDFFLDSAVPESQYVFVSVSMYEAIHNKYFR
jgi:hypothetical protein